jgi:hypothetical protein
MQDKNKMAVALGRRGANKSKLLQSKLLQSKPQVKSSPTRWMR